MNTNSFDLPAFGRGWVCSQTNRSTDIRLESGELVHANRRIDLRFGQYVTAVLKNHLKGGSFDGEIYDAQVLPELERPDNRPVVLLDESNLSGLGEPVNPATWKYGATKCFALGLGIETMNRRPFFVADPCGRKRAYALHTPSVRAIAAIQARSGWSRRTFDLGRTKDNADIGAFSMLLQDSSISLITGLDSYASIRRLFPTIDAPDVKRRIHRAIINGNRIEVPSLGISEVIPLPLFNRAGR